MKKASAYIPPTNCPSSVLATGLGVIDVLRALPRDSHPMAMFSAAIVAMQRESKFAKNYKENYDRMTAWEYMYEDSNDTLAAYYQGEVNRLEQLLAAEGTLERPAFMTVFHNGVLIQNHFELQGDTPYHRPPAYRPHAAKGPISLQDHGNPVRFRNIWVRELKELGHRRVEEPKVVD